MDESPLILTDEAGRTLLCQIETTLSVNGVDYVLLQPVDYSVQIFAWEEGEDEEDGLLVDIEEEEIDLVFPIAQAVLAEQNLSLKRTAYTLTVAGELPEVVEEEIFTIDAEEDDACEEFQELAHFFHEEQAYSVFTALNPLMFFARRNAEGKVELISPEEISEIQPYIEKHFMDLDEDV